MIGEWIRKQTSGLFQDAARLVVRAGISANAVTLAGLAVTAVAAYLIALGRHPAAGATLCLAGLLDGLDGSVARVAGEQSPFGAFWDSLVDRLSESVTFLGGLFYFMAVDSEMGVVVTFVAMVGSLMVSYARARAEGLGLTMREGLLTRLERVSVLVIGLLVGHLLVAVWIIALLSVFTVLQRTYLVWTGLHSPRPT
jgi:CDP-diacylglycerol--glycerol-3-phosphate 3-phosphatidyltransferase